MGPGIDTAGTALIYAFTNVVDEPTRMTSIPLSDESFLTGPGTLIITAFIGPVRTAPLSTLGADQL